MKKDGILLKSRIMCFVILCLFPLIACSAENKTDATTAPVRPGDSNQSTESNPSARSGETRSFDLGSSVSLEMVWIPGGTFQMGSPSSESGRGSNEGPVHTVELDGFWMGKTEVMNAQFRKFRSSHDSGSYEGNCLNGDNQPVVSVSWEDAKAFCDWLANRTGQPFTLPTEAQWEYACRAGTATARFTGDSDASLHGYANAADATAKRKWSNWTCFSWDDGYAVSSPVGIFKANQFGLYDMIGNVWEWCADWYGDYISGRQENSTGPSSGPTRVFRGGCWFIPPKYCRSAYRYGVTPERRSRDLGFRVCLSPVR